MVAGPVIDQRPAGRVGRRAPQGGRRTSLRGTTEPFPLWLTQSGCRAIVRHAGITALSRTDIPDDLALSRHLPLPYVNRRDVPRVTVLPSEGTATLWFTAAPERGQVPWEGQRRYERLEACALGWGSYGAVAAGGGPAAGEGRQIGRASCRGKREKIVVA